MLGFVIFSLLLAHEREPLSDKTSRSIIPEIVASNYRNSAFDEIL